MRALQIIKKIAIVLGITLVVAAAALFVVLRFYEDDVVAFAFEESKDVFTRPVNIDDIDLAFWHTFPNASLHLQQVYIPDSFDAKDTLLHAEDVYLEFNLFDLFRGHYELLELEMDGATVKIKYNSKGEDNYHFWKASDDTTGYTVALEEVMFTETRFYYRDEQAKKVVDIFTEKTIAEGDLTEEQCELKMECDAFLKQLWSNNQTLWQQQAVKCEALIHINFTEKNYQFGETTIEVGDLKAYVQGVINTMKDPYFDLTLSGDKIQLPQLLSLLPAEVGKSMEQYDPDGQVGLKATYKGTLSKNRSPELSIGASIQNGNMQSLDGEVELKNITLESNIQSKDGDWVIDLKQCQAALAGGQVAASGRILARDKIEVDMQLQANAEASDLKHFFNLDTLEICNGQVQIEVKSKGLLQMAPGDTILDFAALHNTGRALWSNGEMKLKNSNRHFTGLQATVELDNANAHVKGLNGAVNGCDFAISGSFRNLVPFLLDDQQRLMIEATLKSDLMDFNQLLETEQGSDEAYQLSMPKRIDFAFQSNIKKFIFRQFYANEINCIAHLNDGRFFIDPLQFKTAGGQLRAQLSLDQTASDRYFVNCLANVEQMDIQELFREFENFDQSFIQDKHLRGKATAMVQFQAPLSTALEVQYKDIYSVIDLRIQEGQLIELESLQEIALYLKNNKWIAPFVDEDKFAEKLKNVRFSTLENTIEIKDERIDIPMMDIRSTAMDISISGAHNFSNKINYTLGFNIRDILMRKEKEWQEQDDGLGRQLFIYMRGTTENPEFGVDKEAAKAERKVEMQEEKQNMKALLKEEFGLFKRDNQVGAFKETITMKETTTTIEWDGFDAPQEEGKEPNKPKDTPTKPNPPPPADSKPKKTPKWLKEKE